MRRLNDECLHIFHRHGLAQRVLQHATPHVIAICDPLNLGRLLLRERR
jgi:hypothetical protein